MLYRNWFNFFVPLFWEASFLAGISSIIVYHKYLLQGDISQSDPCIYTLKCAIVKAEGEEGEESGDSDVLWLFSNYSPPNCYRYGRELWIIRLHKNNQIIVTTRLAKGS